MRVKFVGRIDMSSTEIWSRQIDDGESVKDCKFIFDLNEKKYDWFAVYDDLPRYSNEGKKYYSEILCCPPENTILITSEPSSVRRYPRDFVKQFNYIMSSQEPEFINHPGHIYTQTGLRWYYGIGSKSLRNISDIREFPPLQKEKDISTVTSIKSQLHTLHHQRLYFVKKISQMIPELIWYGHGKKHLDDKADALDTFRYHLAIENHISLHHWTEKLSDSYLGCTLPFYIGAPNITEYFPVESFISLDLWDIEKSAKIIKKMIQQKEWEKRLPSILKARQLVLDRYGLFQNLELLLSNISKQSQKNYSGDHSGKIFSSHDARSIRPLFSLFERFHNLSKFMPDKRIFKKYKSISKLK